MMDERIEKNKRQTNLTPEQEQRARKIAIFGIVVLSVLLVALLTTIITVLILNKVKKEKEILDPLKDSKLTLIDHDAFDKIVNKKSFQELSDEAKKELFDKDKAYMMFYDSTVDKSVIETVKNIIKKEKRNYGFVGVNLDKVKEKDKLLKNVKQFIKSSNLIKSDDELKEKEDLKKLLDEIDSKKFFLLEVDSANLHALGSSSGIGSYYTEFDKIKGKLTEILK